MEKQILNVTPHDLTFRNEDGTEFTIRPSGYTLPAKVEEKVVKMEGDIVFVTPTFVTTLEGEKEMQEIREKYPNHIVVGSMISAQAYPICGMISAKGFERKTPSEKRVDPLRFTIFNRRGEK